MPKLALKRKAPPPLRTFAAPPVAVVSDCLNTVKISLDRVNRDRASFAVHVSAALVSDGPWAFCPREQVLTYYGSRFHKGKKLTPGRKLLFATGHFMHEFLVKQFLAESPYAECVYAKWSCEDHHTYEVGTWGAMRGKACGCGKPMHTHNEIDLFLPTLHLTGHPDMILLVDGVFYIHEFKTIDRKDISFDDIYAPLADHRLQVSFYYKIMKAMGFNVSRRLTITYIDRSNTKLYAGNIYKSFAVLPDSDEVLSPFRNRLLHVKEGLKTGRLPPRICPNSKCERSKGCDVMVECFERKATFLTGEPVETYRPADLAKAA